MLNISREFVCRWSAEYDQRSRDSLQEEEKIREWLAGPPERKYLNKKYFVRVGRWKTKRQTKNYKDNDAALVEEATRLAYNTSNERLKLHILTVLKGVGVAVGATILHFLRPKRFPIFDVRARSSLKKAGKWGDVNDDSDAAWEKYVATMRGLSTRLGVSLRKLDKALWAYDKWGQKSEEKL